MCMVILALLLCLAEVPELAMEGDRNTPPSRVVESGKNTHLGATLKGRHMSENILDM